MRSLLQSYTVWSRRALLGAVGLLAVVAGTLFLSVPAFAVFTRPYLTQLTGTPTGPLGEEVPFGGVAGIAVDSRSPGHVWVGDSGQELVDEFSGPSNVFVSPPMPCATVSLAYDDTSEELICRNSEWVAVDNSTGDDTTGDVLFAKDSGGVPDRGSVSRLNASGVPMPFTCLEGISAGYINGSGELVGRQGELWENNFAAPVTGIAVNSGHDVSKGDIYVVYTEPGNVFEVDQFTSTGCFLQALKEGGEPLEPFEGPGNAVKSVAVDPTDGDVLIEAETRKTGADSVIDEFTASGGYLGQVTMARGLHGGSIAVSGEGDLYAGIGEETEGKQTKPVVDEFGPGAFYPDAITGEMTANQRITETEGRATLNGTVNDDNHELSECYFEYVDAAEYRPTDSDPYESGSTAECVEPDAKEVSVDARNHEVHANVAGLKPGATYDYRLVATTDVSEHGGTKNGENASFAAAAPPALEEVSVGSVSSSSVDFSVRIDPLGSNTTYRFEYVEAERYQPGVSDPYAAGGSFPAPPGEIGSGDDYVSVRTQVGGLSPATVYHFSVLAVNGVGATSSSDGIFVTSPVSNVGVLPDGRAYEMVTPPNKEDAEDLFGAPPSIEATGNHEDSTNYDVGYASKDGNHFLLDTEAAFGSFPTAGEDSYVFSRGETGWTFSSVASSSLGVQSGAADIFDPNNFSVVGFHDTIGQVGNGSVEDLVGPPGGPYTMVASGAEKAGTEGENPNLVGGSADLSIVIVASRGHRLPLCEGGQERLAKELYAGTEGLYEWSADRLCLSLVDVKSQAEGGGLISTCGAELGLGAGVAAGSAEGSTHGAVSADGSRIFFTAPDPHGYDSLTGKNDGRGCWNGGTKEAPQLYMRENGETTVKVSAPEEGVKQAAVGPAVYVGASEDGSKVFFITKNELTKGAQELGLHDVELYEYNTDVGEGRGKLVRVSGGEPGVTVGAGVENVPAISADGSTVYFDASGKLTGNAPAGGGLYRYDTVAGTTTYVAPSGDYPALHEPNITWYGAMVLGNEADVVGLWTSVDYYTTANGEFLVFPSTQNLTGYNSDGQQELYRYDAEDGGIACLSCNPNGSLPSSGARFTRSAVNLDNPAGSPPDPVSENGEYVFFDTKESLLPQDTNGKLDVYEWHDGSISSISTGQSSSDDFFLDSGSYVNTKGRRSKAGMCSSVPIPSLW